jgi:vancomycin resistance protein VanW
VQQQARVRLLGSVRDVARPVLGPTIRRVRREAQWLDPRVSFAADRSGPAGFPQAIAHHSTPLVRKLAGLDPELQRNKVVNLAIAAERLDGVVVQPGQRLSFWRLVGRPARSRGFVDGLVLDHGNLSKGVGGGLCQMTNLLYWMTLHTPLTVVERWRHSYDVFPDSGRTQPFGSGATCAWPVLDLQIENRTQVPYRLSMGLTPTELTGSWCATAPYDGTFEVYERVHLITHEGPSRYVRHNQLWRRELARDGRLVADVRVAENHALLMYAPFLGPGGSASTVVPADEVPDQAPRDDG